MNKEKTIDFSNLGGPVYAGRPRGVQARKALKLDAQDKEQGSIKVLIPEDTYSLNSSYFLGLFGPSVIYFGSMERFKAKYLFEAPDFVMIEIDRGIERALVEVKPL